MEIRLETSRLTLDRADYARGGFTLIELLIVVTVLIVAFLSLSKALVTSMALTRVNRESALASDGVREMAETLEGLSDFAGIFRLYNSDPGDDPGPGTAPGSGFAVPGLSPIEGDDDGFVGEIVFPTLDVLGQQQLREDVLLPELGMPRDLDGNGTSNDPDDKANTYRLLPVIVRVRWLGATGERVTEIRTLVADR
jgi:prepilin-type N-terminal cleavage/methylation domain-containing protein